MDLLSLAKRRRRRLHREEGAALFVVSMTIVALASVGLYALAAAQNEVMTSGNERVNTQTHYLSQYGIISAAHEMVASKAQLYLGLMLSSSTIDSSCVSLPGVPATASILTRACRRIGSQELYQTGGWAAPVTLGYGATPQPNPATVAPFTAGITPGSLGPAPILADFFIELTDPNQTGAPPRYATDLHFCFVQLTVTSGGITQPLYVNSANYTAQFGSEGIEMQRARILAGPVQCPR
jgi:hypothetical protein